MKLLNPLYEHFRQNKNSLIARIYGLYSIKTNIFGTLDIIVMQNTARLVNKHAEILKFDLKGSLVNRLTTLGPKDLRFWRYQLKYKNCLKDKNLLQINHDLDYPLVALPSNKIELLKEAINSDSEFLRSHNLMDYSLLLVIEHVKAD